MKVRFWGTRGSLPVAHGYTSIQRKLRAALKAASGRAFADDAAIEHFIQEELPFTVSHSYGGNSSCVQISSDGRDAYFICDMGSGARELAGHILRHHPAGKPVVCHILISHPHWDHIMGFPFFTPAYIPGNEIHVYGGHAELEQAFRAQNSAPGFPVAFDALAADIHFHRLVPGQQADIAGYRVGTRLQTHGGDSYGYRIERNGKVLVYSTDSEYKQDHEEEIRPVLEFFHQADLVIFDAMYSLADAVTCKEDWGHSSNIVGVDLCHLAQVRQLCLFHHEPVYDDDTIHRVYQETIRYEELSRDGTALQILSAYDGLVLEL